MCDFVYKHVDYVVGLSMIEMSGRRPVRHHHPTEDSEMSGDLQDLKRQLADVTRELSAMPRHLIGSEKWADRVAERNWLNRTIARMEGWAPLAN
jgi:hypothetical protein